MTIRCCNQKQHPEEHARCSKCIQFLIVSFLILNVIWGVAEMIMGLVVNFLYNHKFGYDGFTNFNLKIRDITYIEHKVWELPMEIQYLEITPKRQYMLDIRRYINENCSKVDRDSSKIVDDNCNSRISDDNRGIYFCEVVENPEVFHDAFGPLIIRWLLFNILYTIPCPFIVLAILWKSQRAHIFVCYCVLQFFPIFVSLAAILDLRAAHDYELCSLDYLFDEFPLRTIFTLLVIIRILLKCVEMVAIGWNIWETQVDRKRRGFGIRARNKNNRVVPISTVRDEVLEGGYNPNEDEGSNTDDTGLTSIASSTMTADSSTTIIATHQTPKNHSRKSYDSMDSNHKSSKVYRKSHNNGKRMSLKNAKRGSSISGLSSSSTHIEMSLDDLGDQDESTEINTEMTLREDFESTVYGRG